MYKHLSGAAAAVWEKSGELAASNWAVQSGVCRPGNFETLALFKDLQGQINRIAHVSGFAKVPVDGDLGARTVTAARKAIEKTGTGPMPGTCAELAAAAGFLVYDLERAANDRSVPATVSAPQPSGMSSSPSSSSGEVNASASVDGDGGLTWWLWGSVGAAGLALLWWTTQGDRGNASRSRASKKAGMFFK